LDRQIEYPGEILTDTELLTIQRNIYTALAYLSQAAVGLAATQIADGFACTQQASPNLTVQVAPGAVYQQLARDPNPYGSLGLDTTNLIVKQGINLAGAPSLSCPAPGTAGQSINYLVQVVFGESDGNSTLLSYFNSSNPATAWSGPNNTGASQNTTRIDGVTISVVSGTAATTGTQTTPAATGGAIGLWVVTVANGQATITNSNISLYPGAPLLNSAYKLPNLPTTIQQQPGNYAADTGAANAYVVTLSPVPASWNALIGSPIRFKVANANTSTACTVNVNGLGAKALINSDGSLPTPGSISTGAIIEGIYDGANVQITRTDAPQLAQCYLKWTSGTQCTLVPSGGNRLFNPASGTLTIPSAGVAATINNCYVNGVAGQTLAINTSYLVYVFSLAGVPTLDFCTGQVSTTLDASSGMPIKSGDNTRVLVGSAHVYASVQFNSPNSGSPSITSFWNRRRLYIAPASSTSSTSSTTATVTAASNSVYVWPDEPVSYRITALVYNSTAGDGVYVQPGIDGVVVAASAGPVVSSTVNAALPAISSSFTQPAEGLHTFAAFASAVTGGTANYQIQQTIEVNG
jgi:hypothetical protein